MKIISFMKQHVMSLLSLCVLSMVALPLFFFSGCQTKDTGKTVLLSILARNKAHVLPHYLSCIDAQQYDKKLITVYINTNNNDDDTQRILEKWAESKKPEYKDIIFENHFVKEIFPQGAHEWTPAQFKILGEIRNKSLKKAKECLCDYYFVVDCDNFITPCTLKELVAKDKPIIAPMLRSVPDNRDMYSSFFPDIDKNGYFKMGPDFEKMVLREKVGTFQVPVVHCTYLVNSNYIDKLAYVDGSDDYEFIIFSKAARKNNIPQFVCNEKDFGVLLHPTQKCSLQDEAKMMKDWLKSQEKTTKAKS